MEMSGGSGSAGCSFRLSVFAHLFDANIELAAQQTADAFFQLPLRIQVLGLRRLLPMIAGPTRAQNEIRSTSLWECSIELRR